MLCAVPVVSILYYNIIDRENPVLYTKYYKTVQVQEFVSTNDVLLHCTMGVCMYVSRWAHRPGKATNLHSWPFRCLSKIRDLQVWPGVSHHSSIAHVHTRDRCLDGLFFFTFLISILHDIWGGEVFGYISAAILNLTHLLQIAQR